MSCVDGCAHRSAGLQIRAEVGIAGAAAEAVPVAAAEAAAAVAAAAAAAVAVVVSVAVPAAVAVATSTSPQLNFRKETTVLDITKLFNQYYCINNSIELNFTFETLNYYLRKTCIVGILQKFDQFCDLP